MKTFKEMTEAFKEVPTHLKSGKPNDNHPAYTKHKAAYDAERKAALAASKKERAPKEGPNLDKIFYDLTGIIGQFYPDGDPADYFPKYYRQNNINYEIARKAFKKHGYKDEYDYIESMSDDMGYANESVEELEELSKSTLGNYAKTANDARAHETDDRKADNRGTGVMKALDKLAGKKSGPLKAAAVSARFTNANNLHNASKDRETFNRKVDRKVAEGVDEASTMSHQGKTTLKGIKNPDVTQRMAAHDIKPGVKGYADRIALLRDAEAKGKLKEAVGDHTHILDADLRVNKDEYATHKNTVKRGTILKQLKNDHYEVKAGPHMGKIFKLHKDTVIKADLGESTVDEDRDSEFSANLSMDSSSAPSKKFRLKDKKTGITKGIFGSHGAAMKAHASHPEKHKLMIEEVEGTKYGMISFKDYTQIQEEQERILDQKLAIAQKVVQEASPFDWKKTKSQIDWKSDDSSSKDNTGKHTGTYGSETHVAPSDKNKPKEKKSVGRPAGKYDKDYKIDRAKRDTKEYKDALSAKVRAAKEDGFAARKEFKDSMDAAIKKHQLKLAGLDK